MQARSAEDVKGIDVSHWQGNPDWARVRQAGISFAFLKATEGASVKDPMFERNAVSARANGLAVGFYHYAHPELNDPAAEIGHFTAAVDGKLSELPHVLDLEGKASEIGAAALTRWAGAWLNGVAASTGKPVMLYASASFAARYFGKELARYPLWIAHYGTNRPMPNRVWSEWTAFQYSDQGKVSGIAGLVDLNVMDTAAFAKYTSPDTVALRVGGDRIMSGRLIENRTWVPVRAVGEALGGTVGWTGKEATVNGKVLDTKLFDSVSYVPILQLAAALGVPVGWDAAERTATIGK